MRMLLIPALFAGAAAAACVPVENEYVRARDLAGGAPELASLDGETVFGYAPQPGAVRVISAEEIRRFAAAHGLRADASSEVCIEYPLRRLEQAAVELALRAAVEDGVAVELVDFTRGGVPAGKLVFDRKALLVPIEPVAEPLLWRGYVLYGAHRAAAVWARVRLTVTRAEVVALRDLPPNEPITPNDIRVDTRQAPLSKRLGASSREAVEGMLPRRTIPAGTPIRADWLRAPEVVRRGDQVPVTVISASAILHLHARAESSARAGERVVLTNVTNGKRFEALVDRRGEARIQLPGESK